MPKYRYSDETTQGCPEYEVEANSPEEACALFNNGKGKKKHNLEFDFPYRPHLMTDDIWESEKGK